MKYTWFSLQQKLSQIKEKSFKLAIFLSKLGHLKKKKIITFCNNKPSKKKLKLSEMKQKKVYPTKKSKQL